ncbi:MAG: hybrid sensor histidine kinase/response regulator [Candidatus Flexifilum sp.]
MTKKVLVIEDAHSLRRDIIEMLGFEGYDAYGAENGLIGVERARELSPDLIICDIMMPGLDGYGVLEALRSEATTSMIPFIFLTARTDRVDIRQGMELGADDYLTKPFTAAELLNTVHTRLEKRAQLDEIINQRMGTLRGNIILALPHELRTPLSVILGFSDLIMTDAPSMDAARIVEMSRHINNAGMRLYRLIENFLTYAHTEIILTDPEQREAMLASRMLYPLSAIENYAVMKARQHEREADLKLDIEDVPAISILEDSLKKIIEELVDNACKFSQKGQPIVIRARVEGNWYIITVSDSGRGMTPEQIQSIGAYMQFERRIYEQQGMGLGLVICRRLAEFHGGKLEIRSQHGEGTTVEIRIPVRELPTADDHGQPA